VHGRRVEQRADLPKRADDLLVTTAPDQRSARSRGGQPQDDPHRRGLAGAIRAEEARHVPWAHREAEIIDSGEST
jgi:hypothetical protein